MPPDASWRCRPLSGGPDCPEVQLELTFGTVGCDGRNGCDLERELRRVWRERLKIELDKGVGGAGGGREEDTEEEAERSNG